MIANLDPIAGRPARTPPPADFETAVSLLAVYTDASNQIDSMQSDTTKQFLAIIEARKKEYATLQAALQEAESELELLAVKHPEWFAEKRSIKTPFGTMSFHKSSPLEVKNEEASIVLVQAEIAALNVRISALKDSADRDLLIQQSNRLSECLREKIELDLDALAKLEDSALKKFRITRAEKNNFTVKPAKIDLGKAVKAAAQKEEKATD